MSVAVVSLGVIPIGAPFINVPGHLVEPPGGAALGVAPDSAGGFLPPISSTAAVPTHLPFIAPRVLEAVHSSGPLFPLQFCWQPQARPVAIGNRILPGDTDYRMFRFLGGKVPIVPHRLPPVGLIRRPVTSGCHKFFILGIGNWVQGQVIGGQVNGENHAALICPLTSRQELSPGYQYQQAPVFLVFDDLVAGNGDGHRRSLVR